MVTNPQLTEQFSLFVTKAVIKDGKMTWEATASDTRKDVFEERMSIPLYNSFLQQYDIQKSEQKWAVFVSLAHYPRLNGVGEIGTVDRIFIDGDQLKARGTFNDTPLGRATYNAIRKDRRDNVSPDKRVRVSIGFYDLKHAHGDSFVWEFKSRVPCVRCANGYKDKVYLEGVLDHMAVTRIPANTRTEIVTKSEGESMTTRFEDAESIVGDEAKVVEKALQEQVVTKSTDDPTIVERAKADTVDIESNKYNFDNQTLVQFLQKLVDAKIVEDDELAKELSVMLAYLTKSTAVERVAERKDVTEADKKAAEKEYGDVRYADAKNKKYPIDTEAHIRAAWNYINKPKNAAKYGSSDVASIKAKIVAAWKQKIDKEGPPSVAKEAMSGMHDGEHMMKKDATMDMDDSAFDDNAAIYRPFGGATTWADAYAYLNGMALESKTYKAFSDYGALANNIMCCDEDEMDTQGKVEALKALTEEFAKKLTPEVLMTMSQADNEIKTEIEKSAPTPATDPMIATVLAKVEAMEARLEKLYSGVPQASAETSQSTTPADEPGATGDLLAKFGGLIQSAVAEKGDARKAALQGILNYLGQAFTDLDAKMAEAERASGISPAQIAQVSEAEDVRQIVKSEVTGLAEQVSGLTAQVTALTNLFQAQLVGRAQMPVNTPAPQGKGIVGVVPQEQPVQKSAQGYSIRDIVKATTTGR